MTELMLLDRALSTIFDRVHFEHENSIRYSMGGITSPRLEGRSRASRATSASISEDALDLDGAIVV
jgi:hypothetical protein